MKLRSMLFVPADDERKFARAAASSADAIILDLEDAVAPQRKVIARETTGRLLTAAATTSALFVRVNALATGMLEADVDAVVGPGLTGVMLPKAEGGHDLATLSNALAKRESDRGLPVGAIKIVVVATETPRAMFNLGTYPVGDPRLVAMTWGAEDLAAAIGATANKEDDGSWTAPYSQARNLCLYASAAAEVLAIDTLYSNFRDTAGLAEDCARARRDGFAGRVAIHPNQVETINASFCPSDVEMAVAQRLVDAFAANPDAGTIGIDGRMYDIPHLKAARRTLAARQN